MLPTIEASISAVFFERFRGAVSSRALRALTVSVFALSGCSISADDDTRASFEVIGTAQNAVHDVDSTPTAFTVPIADGVASWERAKLFFRQYVSTTGEVMPVRGTNGDTVLSNRLDRKSSYRYDVRMKLLDSGYTYTVKCDPNQPGATVQSAKRNAKNLARFIRDGTLEMSLLDNQLSKQAN